MEKNTIQQYIAEVAVSVVQMNKEKTTQIIATLLEQIEEEKKEANQQLLERLGEKVEKKRHAFLEDYREFDKLLSIGHNEALNEVKALIQEEIKNL